MKIGDKTTMKVQVPIIHPVRIFMINRSSIYHNVDYVYFMSFLNKRFFSRYSPYYKKVVHLHG